MPWRNLSRIVARFIATDTIGRRIVINGGSKTNPTSLIQFWTGHEQSPAVLIQETNDTGTADTLTMRGTDDGNLGSVLPSVAVRSTTTGNGPSSATLTADVVSLVGAVQLGGNGVDMTAPWTSYTPTWTGSITNPTLGNGTLVGRYTLIGKTCHVAIQLTIGSTTNVGAGTYLFGVPFLSDGLGYLGTARFTGAAVAIGQVSLGSGSQVMNATFPQSATPANGANMTASAPAAPAAGNVLLMSLTYQIA